MVGGDGSGIGELSGGGEGDGERSARGIGALDGDGDGGGGEDDGMLLAANAAPATGACVAAAEEGGCSTAGVITFNSTASNASSALAESVRATVASTARGEHWQHHSRTPSGQPNSCDPDSSRSRRFALFALRVRPERFVLPDRGPGNSSTTRKCVTVWPPSLCSAHG